MFEDKAVGMLLHELAPAARSLRLEDFCQRYSAAFLLLHASLVRPSGPARTVICDEGEQTEETFLTLLPLRRRPDSAFPFISVGRTENNDICLPDVSVSKFHAYFRGHEGGFVVQDGRSRNGTFLNDVAVPSRDAGPAVPVQPGAALRFGAATTTFLTASEVIKLCTSA